MSDSVLFEQRDGVQVITINRPEAKNALDKAVAEAVATAVDELEPVIRKSQARVSVDVPATLRAQADYKRLAQMTRALIENAIKFSPENPRVKVSAGRDDGQVYLRVADHGIGIEPELVNRIFERFYQVDNTATRAFGGTGMGLALVDRLMTMHKGRVQVDSTPGKGSTFTLYLPAAEATPRKVKSAANAVHEVG